MPASRRRTVHPTNALPEKNRGAGSRRILPRVHFRWSEAYQQPGSPSAFTAAFGVVAGEM